MNRNVTILIIILVVILIAGYLLWLRGRFEAAQVQTNITPTPQITEVPTATPTIASPSATASPSAKPTGKVTPASQRGEPTKAESTTSGKSVR